MSTQNPTVDGEIGRRRYVLGAPGVVHRAEIVSLRGDGNRLKDKDLAGTTPT
jgi:hypothetical protein